MHISSQNSGNWVELEGVGVIGEGISAEPDFFRMIESILKYMRAVVSSSGAAPGLVRTSNSFFNVAVAF